MPGIEIQTELLRKRLGKKQALDGLSLRFAPTRLHTIIGPNGAGKTTFLRHITGLLKADSGRIVFRKDGAEVAAPDLRSKITYVTQHDSLYGDLSVAEHLAFFAKLYGLRKEEYAAQRDELLSLSRLRPFMDRPAMHLSGGMYKKLALICALLPSPEVVLLDEPTVGLDPVSRWEFWELLQVLVDAGLMTIIVTTSYMDEGERSADVHLIDKGKTLAEGEPSAILKNFGVASIFDVFLKGTVAV
ncbi:MAG: ABC transporter ATP-binding protein [Elusimicrobia bacterium]|nr:ABC transporter ATP-binding protein [Elusimicrobiota bacterium]